MTLSPMLVDRVIVNSEVDTQFNVTNNHPYLMEYKFWIDRGKGTKSLYQSEFLIGSGQTGTILVPVWGVTPEKIEVYRICVQEKPVYKKQVGLIARACARLRLYWPASQLLMLQ